MVVFSTTDGSQILDIILPEHVSLGPWQMRGLLEALRHPALHGIVHVRHGAASTLGEQNPIMAMSDINNVNNIAVDALVNASVPTLFRTGK